MELKDLRKIKGYTQTEAADIVGLSRRGYQKLELGENKKANSKTFQYAFAKLSSTPKKASLQKPISIKKITGIAADIFTGSDIAYAYIYKEDMTYVLLGGELSDLDALSYEQELSLAVGRQIRVITIENSAFAQKVLALGFRIFPKVKEPSAIG